MTEAEWLTCAHPQPMLEFLKDRGSDRQFRLFNCACVVSGTILKTSLKMSAF